MEPLSLVFWRQLFEERLELMLLQQLRLRLQLEPMLELMLRLELELRPKLVGQ